jgi:hypothetical protein
VHLFIDTNILETDPFWKSSYARTVLEMARKGSINLYISRVVVEELRLHTVRNFKKTFKAFNGAINDHNRYRPSKLEIDVGIDVETSFNEFYDKQFKYGYIKILEYKNEFFPTVMDRALGRKKPFNDEKTELKDCVIWLTYADYVQSRMLSDCYLLTANTSDFCDKEPTVAEPKEYKVHADLLPDTKKFRVFPSLRDCFKAVLEPKVQKSKRFQEWLEYTKVDEHYVFDLLYKNEVQKLEGVVYREIEKIDADDIYGHDDYFFTGGHCEVEGIEWKGCEQVEIEVVEDDACIVSCVLRMHVRVQGYKYNPAHDGENDRFIEMDEEDVDVKMYISFYLKEDDQISSVDVDSVDISY